ncbi:MAG: ATP-binding protein [Solirubrobacteraceae bacterium]
MAAAAKHPRGETTPLLERERELAALLEALDAACLGDGRMVMVEASPGLGKTRLLREARSLAVARGLRVLSASARALERDLPWSVVREVYGGVLRSGDQSRRDALLTGAASLAAPLFADRPSVEPIVLSAAVHGLYWLTSDLATESPLMIAIDDVHWLDAASAHWLSHLAGRVSDLPVLLLAAARPAPQTEASGLWRTLGAQTVTTRLGLAPLNERASCRLVKVLIGGDIDGRFAAACHEASGGNPFLLCELSAALRAERERPDASDPERVARARPEAISRSVLLRLAQLGGMCVEVAFAVVVLGARATVANVATLCGIASELARDAVDALVAADVLRHGSPLEFMHPIVRSVVAGELPAASLAHRHLRAAELLHSQRADASTVALHLLMSEPGGRDWVVDVLREAAVDAAATGAPEAAMRFLEHALAEPPNETKVVEVLLELGRAEVMLGHPGGSGHLRAALDACTEVPRRAVIAIDLAGHLLVAGSIEEAVAICRAATAELGEDHRELRLELDALAVTAAKQFPDRSPEGPSFDLELLPASTRGERLLLGAVANGETVQGARPLDDLAALCARALGGGALLRDVGADSPVYWAAATTLIFGERYVEAGEAFEAAAQDSRGRGSTSGYALYCAFRSVLDYRLGNLEAAIDAARRALELIASEHLPMTQAYALSFLLDALVARGAVDAAEQAIHGVLPDDAPPLAAFALLRASRGRLHLAAGRPRDAVADLLEAGRYLTRTLPGFWPWRAEAALALRAAGDLDQASELAAQELALAERGGSRWAHAIALRSKALVQGGDIALLARAARLLEGSPAKLERARILVDLGAALRRAKRVQEALEVLREGLDLADRCAAEPTIAHARTELAAAGARPRNARRIGADALTASELRVARMAAAGASNRDIAQALFVSLRTVETHLTHAYRKLGVEHRGGLIRALDADTERAEPLHRSI